MNKRQKEIRSYCVNPETAEIVNEIYTGDKIVRAETTKYLQQTVEIGKEKSFIKLFENTIVALGNEALTGNQWRVLTTIIKYFRYDSGLVSFRNGKPLTVEDISNISKLPLSSCFMAVDKLVQKKIIGKSKVGHDIKYYMNPFIFCRGTRINRTLFTMFENSRWKNLYEADVE